MSYPNEQPEIARPATLDPGRADDNLYEPGEGDPPDSADQADGVGQKVIGELRERRND
ncbi:hypothetical protein SAMN05421837_102938 [Amycolatopsis pretoriensis]|uniref:Uncharacterized protein n=1 Tax=Amycolatopsis pretoriensis TaxID=218821 RepID=A0A1H5QGH5_9PSEU|nr:hypothetical protein [Amycolatopsis pretoriensis]SEF24954.1 hypothetical protein SAMN05421837_102938 [Amycolatopsis pretoriensis]